MRNRFNSVNRFKEERIECKEWNESNGFIIPGSDRYLIYYFDQNRSILILDVSSWENNTEFFLTFNLG